MFSPYYLQKGLLLHQMAAARKGGTRMCTSRHVQCSARAKRATHLNNYTVMLDNQTLSNSTSKSSYY